MGMEIISWSERQRSMSSTGPNFSYLRVLSQHQTQQRHSHRNAIRGDALNPTVLGMTATVSEDVIRDVMKRMPEAEALHWLSDELRACVQPVLSQPWILDIDTTVKPIYGHQQGAQIGYNPHKPGRPSLNYHSYRGGAGKRSQ